ARPRTVGGALAAAGFTTAYVADLDAIGGDEPAWSVYRELMAFGLPTWVDAGLSSAKRARALAGFTHHARRLAGVVAGLESLDSPRVLLDISRAVDSRQLI